MDGAAIVLIAALLSRDFEPPPLKRIVIEIPVAPESPRTQSLPDLFAHAAGVRVVWNEGRDVRLADFDRSGRRHGDAVTIQTGVDRWAAAMTGTDLFVAWQRGETIEGLLVDRDRNVVERFPILVSKRFQLSDAGCKLGECVVGWTLPYATYDGTNDKAYVARFAVNGAPLGEPMIVPNRSYSPGIQAGERDYLVTSTAYDLGRPYRAYALLRDGAFVGYRLWTGRSASSQVAGNGREWLLVNYPMRPYDTRDFITSVVNGDGDLVHEFAYDLPGEVSLGSIAWNGFTWVAAFRDGYLATLDTTGELVHGGRLPPVFIAGGLGYLKLASAGDGLTWLGYARDGRCLLRRVMIFR